MNNLSIEERKKLLKDEFIITVQGPTQIRGGQSIGVAKSTIIGVHKALEIRIEIGFYKSNYKNKELVQTIFDLIIDELVK